MREVPKQDGLFVRLIVMLKLFKSGMDPSGQVAIFITFSTSS